MSGGPVVDVTLLQLAAKGVRIAQFPSCKAAPPSHQKRQDRCVFIPRGRDRPIDITVFEDVYQRYGHLLFGPAPGPLKVAGILERRGRGVSITAKRIERLDP